MIVCDEDVEGLSPWLFLLWIDGHVEVDEQLYIFSLYSLYVSR